MAIRVLEETGLLPHLNPGVMNSEDFRRLKPVAPSMGMMLETTAERLFTERGAPHFGSPDKDPKVRLQVLADAGRAQVPFTTGILIGLGETPAERVDAIFALQRVSREYDGIQEVIVQNFRAKPDTKMRDTPDAELADLAATIAVTRLVLGAGARIQAPPNLVGEQYQLILDAGIDDWGGVSPLTPDHVNPERPWPQIDELAQVTKNGGFTLRERLTIYPPYQRRPWLDPRLAAHVAALADPATGLADESAIPQGRPPAPRPRSRPAASGPCPAYAESVSPGLTDTGLPSPSLVGQWLRAATTDPAALPDEGYAVLLGADGPQLDELCELADSLRERAVGNGLTYVVNRNLDPSAVAGADRGRGSGWPRWWPRRVNSVPPRSACRDRCRLTPTTTTWISSPPSRRPRPRSTCTPSGPPELLDGAARRGMPLAEFLTAAREAGLGSVPGTAARILDDDVRGRLAGGRDLPVSRWVEVIEAAHQAGLPSTATMVFGHIETPAHQVAHLRTLAGIQDRTGGFTEFIAMPFVPAAATLSAGLSAPAGFPAPTPAPTPAPGLVGADVPGPSWRQVLAVHAVARLMLHERIGNIQAAWPKFGLDASVDLLRSGANDLGGLLLDGRLAPDAGAEAGLVLTLDDIERVARELGRPVWQRTTGYGKVMAGV